jgi:acyl-CoA reductase-like NAD-dependent aldehyde dehydrogenase
MTIYEQVLDATSRAVGALTVGDPLDPATVGAPVVNKVPYDRIPEGFSDVGNSGVRTVVGGHRVAESEFGVRSRHW